MTTPIELLDAIQARLDTTSSDPKWLNDDLAALRAALAVGTPAVAGISDNAAAALADGLRDLGASMPRDLRLRSSLTDIAVKLYGERILATVNHSDNELRNHAFAALRHADIFAQVLRERAAAPVGGPDVENPLPQQEAGE